MVVVTRNQEVRNRVVTLDELISPDELASIRNYVNRNFEGWTLEAVRRELSSRLEKASATYDEILRKLTLLYSKGLLAVDAEPEVHTEGASNLVGLDLVSEQPADPPQGAAGLSGPSAGKGNRRFEISDLRWV